MPGAHWDLRPRKILLSALVRIGCDADSGRVFSRVHTVAAVGMVVAAVAAAPALGVGQTLPRAAAKQSATSASSRLEIGILQQINALRRRHGLVPLKLSRPLGTAARQHSESMAASGYFAHESADGTPFWKRVQRYYGSGGWSYWSTGENLLWASPDLDPARALKLWLASPKHRANMLTARWREIGISAVHAAAAPGTYDGLEVTIVTTDFGVRR